MTVDHERSGVRIGSLIDRLDGLAARERVTVGDVVESFGAASFVPALLMPALLVVSPLSGVPFLSTICGVLIGVTALQIVARRDCLWLPGPIMRRGVGGERLRGGLQGISRFVGWLDRTARRRLTILLTPPLDRLVFLLAAACGFMMPFLEFVPFSSSLLGLAVVLFGTGFLTGDGLFVLLGLLQIAIIGTVFGSVLFAVV